MAQSEKDDKKLSSKDKPKGSELDKSKLFDQKILFTKEDFSNIDQKTSVSFEKTVLGVVTGRPQAIIAPSSGVLMPESVIQKIKQNKIRTSKFDASQIIRLEDGPKVLSAALNAELGFTPDKLRKIAENLDPRIVIVIENEVFFDKKLLAESFEGYLQAQQDNNLLQMSRSSRAGLRRNLVLREAVAFLEQILKRNPSLKEHLTERINLTLSDSYKSMENDDVLAFLESYRINEEKRRLRNQESELERLAIEQLEQFEVTKRL